MAMEHIYPSAMSTFCIHHHTYLCAASQHAYIHINELDINKCRLLKKIINSKLKHTLQC
jgi:hypothetical protein